MQVPRILKYRNSDPDINSFSFGIEISFLYWTCTSCCNENEISGNLMLFGIFYLYEFKILKIFKNYIFQSYDLIFFSTMLVTDLTKTTSIIERVPVDIWRNMHTFFLKLFSIQISVQSLIKLKGCMLRFKINYVHGNR